MSDYVFMAACIAATAITGAFWWWLLWTIAGSKLLAESALGRRVLKGLGLFIGIALPTLGVLMSVLHFYM